MPARNQRRTNIMDDELSILYNVVRLHPHEARNPAVLVEEKRILVEYAKERRGTGLEGFAGDSPDNIVQFWFDTYFLNAEKMFDDSKTYDIFGGHASPVGGHERGHQSPAQNIHSLPWPVSTLADAMRYEPTQYTITGVRPEAQWGGSAVNDNIVPHTITLSFMGGSVPVRMGREPLELTLERGYEQRENVAAEIDLEVRRLEALIQKQKPSYSIECVESFNS